MSNQKAMVVSILDNCMAEHGDNFKDHAKEQIAAGLTDGSIPWSGDRTDAKKVNTYAGALVSNYLKKEANYNEGVPYSERKSVRGPRVTDPDLKELNFNIASLKAQPTLSDDQAALLARAEVARDNRIAFLAAQKASKDLVTPEEATANLTRMLSLVPSAS